MSLVYPPFAGLLMTPGSLLSLPGLRIVWFAGVVVALQALGFVALPAGEAWRYWTDYAWNVRRMFDAPGVIFNQSLRGAVDRLTGHDTVMPWALVAGVIA